MLKIRLRANEKIIINGAVLCASARTELSLENRAAVLRGREVMKPDAATTPATRLYFDTMLHYVDEEGRSDHQARLLQRLSEMVSVSRSVKGQALCARYARLMAQRDHYAALGVCRKLIKQERDVAGYLEHAA